jgi:hypothetical protein
MRSKQSQMKSKIIICGLATAVTPIERMKMRSRFFLQLTIAAVLIFGRAAVLHALPAVQVTESPQSGGTTEYTVTNNTFPNSPVVPNNPIDISVFLSTTTGSAPTTTNADWTAEALNDNLWDASMGFPAVSEPANPTWQQYTGMTYMQAFPNNPVKVNGYYLDFTFNSDSDTVSIPNTPIIPGASLGNFFFTGSPGSTFLIAGPADPEGTGVESLMIGDADTFSGTSVDLPEPASACLLAVGSLALLGRRRRRQHSPRVKISPVRSISCSAHSIR